MKITCDEQFDRWWVKRGYGGDNSYNRLAFGLGVVQRRGLNFGLLEMWEIVLRIW